MKLLEIKNNLVKIAYDENLALGKFIVLIDENSSYVGQIINLKADIASNYAIAKLIFSFNSQGIVDNYNGTIPSMKAKLSLLPSQDILKLLPVERPVSFGALTQENNILKIDETVFERNLLICAEKFENIATLIKNCTTQLVEFKEKTVVVDIDHTFGEFEPIRFRRNFKLPLNAKMIDFIYENDLEEVDATSKAVIQDIFYEVQEYAKTVEFIPIDTFINVVASQYEQTQIPELALLKNKLLKYKEDNVFAQTEDEITGLKDAINENILTYIDIADVSDNLQRELISYIHNVLSKMETYIYNFVKITNRNSDKKLLLQLLDNDHIFTTIICSHNYKYVQELKQKAENIIFFAPQTTQHDFATYNTFLSKLSNNEFILYGNLTQYVPFIVELNELSEELPLESPKSEEPQKEFETKNNEFEITTEQEIPEFNNGFEAEQEIPEFNNEFKTEQEMPEFNNEFEAEQEIPEFNNEFEAEQEMPEFSETTHAGYDFSALEELEAPQAIVEEAEISDELLENNEIFDMDTSHDEMVEQVARDVDEVFYNKANEIPSIDEVTSNDNLTEDDLDFIEDLAVDTPDEQSDGQSDDNFELTEETPEELPVYESETPENNDTGFEQGDTVSHPKYGKGVIEKLIKYGNKTLCSISFENVGRRLLDPAISELTKEL